MSIHSSAVPPFPDSLAAKLKSRHGFPSNRGYLDHGVPESYASLGGLLLTGSAGFFDPDPRDRMVDESARFIPPSGFWESGSMR